MKRMMTYLLLVGLLFCTGCISEDLSGCPHSFQLDLSYQGDGTTEIFQDKIEHVVLYVFDAADACVESREATSSELALQRVMLRDYPTGNYRVVCVGNARNTMITDPGEVAHEDMRFADPAWFTGDRISTNDSLYHAVTDITITGGRSDRGTAQFASAHYKMYVEVSGFELDTRMDGVPTLELHGVLPATDFENQACEDPVTYYLTTTPYDTSKKMITSQTNIMRNINDETELELLDASGNSLASVHLPTFLSEHDEIDLTGNEILIPIAFRFKDADVEITVPDWYVEDVKPEI